MNRAAFESHIETQPAPTPKPGDLVIADTLSSRKSAQARDALKSQGNGPLFSAARQPRPDPD